MILLCACSQEESVPSGTYDQDKMAKILADIHLAESRVTKLQLKSTDSSIMIFDKLKSDIWKKYKVDTALYNSSYAYYIKEPKKMRQIYEKVTKNLEAREKTKNIKL